MVSNYGDYMYIFDIDGTLSDPAHRLHHIHQKKKNWKAFFSKAKHDPPIRRTLEIAKVLYETQPLLFITGRSEMYRKDTTKWLNHHGLTGTLLMRPNEDRRTDAIVKRELLSEYLLNTGSRTSDILGVFEDRQQVVDMWRGIGLLTYQVAEGDF